MKKINISLFLLFIYTCASAQSQGPNNPTSFSYSHIGCLSCPGAEWQNMNNITLADGLYSNVQLSGFPNCFQSTCYYSRYLFVTNFGFTIPLNATILGVQANVLRKSTAGTGVRDTLVQLYSGAPVGINHASGAMWTPNAMTISYGSNTDTWGYTLTPDTINSPSFGLALMVQSKALTTLFVTASIDHIEMTVYYSTVTGLASQTHAASWLNMNYDSQNQVLNLFSLSEQKINLVSISDAAGRQVYFCEDAFVVSEKIKIKVPPLKPGIYFSIINSNRETFRQKFTVN